MIDICFVFCYNVFIKLNDQGRLIEIVRKKKFDIISEITNIEIIAAGDSVDERHRLNRMYAKGRLMRWRKMKGFAWVRYINGREVLAEIHWFEAHGIGRQEEKVKRDFRK